MHCYLASLSFPSICSSIAFIFSFNMINPFVTIINSLVKFEVKKGNSVSGRKLLRRVFYGMKTRSKAQ